MSFSFDISQVANFEADVMAGGFSELLEPGQYQVEVVDHELKTNSKGTGEILAIRFAVAEGPRKGKWITYRLNVTHQNEVAQDIARKDLARMVSAMGITSFQEVAELHGEKVTAEVTIRSSEGYKDQNEIKRFSPPLGTQAAVNEAVAQVNQAVASTKMPWEK